MYGNKGTAAQQRTPREAPNTLQSKNTARVIDAVSEGPILGLVNDLQSVFLNDTPLQNPDGTFNFKGIKVSERLGTPDQDVIKGFPYVENEITVGLKVEKATPIVRTIYDSDTDAVRVKVRIPELVKQDANTGDLVGSTVRFDIHVQSNGGGYKRANIAYKWAEFTGDTTASTCRGLKVTVKGSVTGKIGTKQTTTLTAQYRAVGSGVWLTLGSKAVSKIIKRQKSSTVTRDQPNYISRMQNKTETMEVTATFTVTGLDEDDYEYRITAGSLKKAEQRIPNNIVISGKTTTPYEAQYRVPLDGDPPWDVKVTRITDDSASVTLRNDLYWSSYTQVVDAKLIYPDTALYGIEADAEQFGMDVPSRAYEIQGLELQIPSNYDPETREYTGVWDGTFQTAWTDNPAWVLYGLLTNERWGLGGSIDADQVDKFSLYTIGEYCDELIDDGFGGTEPRFTFNGIINTRREAYEVINAITSSFRGMCYWGSGAITVVQDSPADPVKLVTPANVIGGKFEYSGSALKSRHTAAVISWNDPLDGYKASIVIAEERNGIQSRGWNQVDTAAFGCTSRGQATRHGKWILDTEKYENETVVYQASFDHMDVRPGDIIAIADPNYAGVRFGGRVVTGTQTVITLDDTVTLESGETYQLSLVLPDGGVEDKDIVNAAGDYTDIVVSSPFSKAPLDGAMWVITASNVEPRKFRVVLVEEQEKNIFQVTALFHDPDKYDRVEDGLIVEPPDYSLLPEGAIEAVTNVSISEYLYKTGSGATKAAATLSWETSTDPRVGFYEVEYQGPEDPDYKSLKTTTGNSVDLLDITPPGSYNFRITAIDGLGGTRSQSVEVTFDLSGLNTRPNDVASFYISVNGDTATLSWEAVTNLNLKHYVIKFTPSILSPTWEDANVLIPQVPAASTSVAVPSMVGTYFIKAVTHSNVESENANSIQSTIGVILNMNVISTIDEHPSFSGTKVDTAISGSSLQLDSADSIDDWADVDAIFNFDLGEDGILDYGEYYFYNAPFDLGAVYTSRITPDLRVSGGNLYGNMDLWTDVDAITNWDEADASQWAAILQINTTNDDPADSLAEWSGWGNIIVGDYTCRGFDWRLLLYSYEEGISPIVSNLSIQVDMPDRTVGDNDVVSNAAGTAIVFTPAFKATPSIAISAQNMGTGDYFTVTSQSESGFTVRFFNSGGTGVSRTFDYIAKGYGYES